MGAVGSLFVVGAGRLYTERRFDHPYERGAQGACYRNAFELAIAHPELTYCEGRALSMGAIPIEHAWCVDAEGKVVDTTWTAPDDCYYGVCFDTAWLIRWIEGRKHYGVLAEFFPQELADHAPTDFLHQATDQQIAKASELLATVRSKTTARSRGLEKALRG